MTQAAVCLLVGSLCGAACARGNEPMPGPPAQATPTPLPPAVSFGSDHPKTEYVSLVRVLANPTSLNKKAITLDGFLDGHTLCLHKEDADNRLSTNCVSIAFPDSPQVQALDRRYVTVSGIVVFGGRAGLSPLVDVFIDDVRSIEPIEDRERARHDLVIF